MSTHPTDHAIAISIPFWPAPYPAPPWGTATHVPIAPHPLTPDALPVEGEIIGYTGPAFYGEDFGDHGPMSGPLRVGKRTGGFAPGFFATALGFDGTGTDEVFVLFAEPATQTLHGYVLS